MIDRLPKPSPFPQGRVGQRRPAALVNASAVAVSALLGLTAMGTVGCAGQKKEPAGSMGSLDSGDRVVISGSPTADTAAFNKANRSLLQAQHGVIEDVAPKPVWRSFRNDRDLALSGAMDEGDPEQGVPTRSSTAIGDHANASEPALGIPYVDAADLPGPVGNSDPAIGALVTAAPYEGPLAPQFLNIQPTTGQPIPRDFPVNRQLLPDGRIRLIWHLRSFGGPNVASAGNGGTARRAITLTPKDLAPLIAVVQGHLA